MTSPSLPGPVPQSNQSIVDLLARIEQWLREADRKTLYSAAIGKGGLTVSRDGAIRVLDGNGIERVFIGSSAGFEGFNQPVVFFRDALGKLRFGIYDPQPVTGGYQPVVWIFDHLDHVVLTSDVNGGMAEPHLTVPLYPQFRDSTFLDTLSSYPTLPVSACTGGTAWEGRISKVSHPRIMVGGTFGRVGGTATPTYTFEVGGTVMETWAETGLVTQDRGPYDIASKLGQTNVTVKLKVSATGGGADRVAIGVLACALRQT